MNTPTTEELRELAQKLSERIPYLKMLVLFGSRATGKTHANSDWDFAVLYDEETRQHYMRDPFSWFEVPGILAQVLNIPDTKIHIDVVELNNCSQLIAHFVARDGKVLYEQEPGEFDKFRQKALLSDDKIQNIYQDSRQNIKQFLQSWKV